MRKLGLILLAVIMLFSAMTGCSSPAPSEAVTPTPEATATPLPTPTPTPVVDSIFPDSEAPVTSGNSGSTVTVQCSMCNGTGSVKYYYGSSSLEAYLDGYDDYSSVKTQNSASASKKVVCPSCSKYVSKLVSKADKAGVTRKWRSSCWSSYNAIMG